MKKEHKATNNIIYMGKYAATMSEILYQSRNEKLSKRAKTRLIGVLKASRFEAARALKKLETEN